MSFSFRIFLPSFIIYLFIYFLFKEDLKKEQLFKAPACACAVVRALHQMAFVSFPGLGAVPSFRFH